MQIAVLGMHRSGTSALTRLLAFIGCNLGSEADFNPARADNPSGDWERTDVWSLNEAMLAAQDASWCRIAPFDPAGFSPQERQGFEQRAAEIVATMDAARPWAIKDPRLCLTFPLWRSAFSKPVCLIVHRDPLQVARSLSRRDGLPLSVGVALWEAYVLSALRHSCGLPRVFVGHEDLMSDPPATLRTLREHLQIEGVEGLHAPDDKQVGAFIDPSLVHGAGDPVELAAHLNPAQQRLARALSNGSALSWNNVPELSAAADDLLRIYFDVLETRDHQQAERDEKTTALEQKAVEVERLAQAKDAAEEHARSCDAAARQHEEAAKELEEKAKQHAVAEREQRQRADALEDKTRSLEERSRELEERAREQHTRARKEKARAEQHLVLADRLREQSKRAEQDLDQVLESSAEMEKLLQLVLSSGRWRFGDNLGELASRLALKSKQPRAKEHAEQIIGRYHDACAEVAQRRAEVEGTQETPDD